MKNLKIINRSRFENPEYATLESAGFDLRANIETPVTLKPMERILIKTGLFLEIPSWFVGYVCSRSGLALKKGIQVLNAPGVIDADYRNEVGVILINLSNEDVIIDPGDRIAQMIIAPYEKVNFIVVEELSDSDRAGGFGSTGIK